MRPALIDHSKDLIDEPSIIAGSAALSGNAIGLAGISRSEAIHDSTKWARIEGSEIAHPDRARSQLLRFHASRQNRASVGFPFDQADCSSAWNSQLDSELEAADAGADPEDIEGGMSHIHAAPRLAKLSAAMLGPEIDFSLAIAMEHKEARREFAAILIIPSEPPIAEDLELAGRDRIALLDLE
jgi:hypothetical protein